MPLACPESRIAVLLALFPVVVAFAGEPVLSPADSKFLSEQSRLMIASARLAPGAGAGAHRNTTAFAIRVPGGNMGYPAFWVRDAVMMLGGDFVPAGEVAGWIRLMASAIREREWAIHSGAVVPAFTVPDHINFDGRPVFYPGTYDSGTKQGGAPFGKYPPLDDQFYFIAAVYEYWKLAGDLGLFRSRVATASGDLVLAELAERVYNAAPSDAKAGGLVTAGDVDSENAKDWGFCDTVFKSGRLLFPSVLKFNAAGQLAELFEAAGDRGRARRYRGEAGRLGKAIAQTFARADGWLASATQVGSQADVWGTAFAVWSGAVDSEVARKASRALVKGYRERTAVRGGLVRHLPGNELWEKCGAAPGTYQNGGYWGTPVGWYIAAMARTDRDAARAMGGEFVRFLREHMRADGLSEAWEWMNPETGKRSNPLYVATVALPYISLVKGGLLR
jgi:hypothetical protein